jgi:surface polysaccharide O-acyltransferase-like enzyme
LELIYNGAAWTAVGPFTFQTARILHYLVYFLAGVSLGAWGLERGPLTSTGVVASRWWRWLILALVLFAVATAVTIAFFTAHLTSRVWELSTDLAFSATCAASCMAFLALFLRFAPSRSRVFEPLSPNSYGIYLLHYVFVSWLLLAMVGTALPAFLKFTVVLSGAILASWLVTSAFRRIPAIAKIV